MEDFRLTIDADATSTVAMRFVMPLTNNRSLYHFHFRFPAPAYPAAKVELSLYLDSVNASDFFRTLEQLFYMDPPASGSAAKPPMIYSVEVQYSDCTGAYAGNMQIEMNLMFPSTGPGSGPSIPPDSTVTFDFLPASGNSPGSSPAHASFSLTGYDVDSFYGFFDDVLWSNPPSPPH
jgi:hypothetical protein